MFRILAAVALLTGCSRASRPDAPLPEEPAEPEGLRWREQLTAGASADEPLPVVVTLHGRGSDPVRFGRFFDDLGLPARVVHLEAPVEEHDGRAWFSFRGKTRDALYAEVADLADAAVRATGRAVEGRASVGKPVLVGFSQGSIVVYGMVLRHPDVFAEAVPVAGGLMSEVPSGRGAEVPPVVAMHGQRDPIMSPRLSISAVEMLRAAGVDAEVRLFPDNVHWIDGEMKRALHEEIRAATAARASGG